MSRIGQRVGAAPRGRPASDPGQAVTPLARRPVPERNQALTATLLAWLTARTDNPLFTYEMRTRTRSGKWADWRLMAPSVFVGVSVLAVAYPDFIQAMSFVTLLHFFTFQSGPSRQGAALEVWQNLASLLLAMQVYVFGLRGQTIGETLIARDRQRGIWGFILLSPLSARQIFRGKVGGQTFGFAAAWVVLGTCELIFYALAAPVVGMVPALTAWLVGQAFVAALFVLGVGLGATLATFPIFMKTLRGASTLLLVGAVGGGVWLNLRLLPLEQWRTSGPMVSAENTWGPLVVRLALGSVYALVLAVPLFAFAEWRVGALRRKDVPFGDGVEG